MKYFILLFTVCFPLLAFAQLTDDFSDGNFTENPQWVGEVDSFIVNTDNELQLLAVQGSGTNTSYLSVPAATQGAANWEFFIRQEFSPSTSNFARVYLRANTLDLNGDVEGYYVQIGGISGDDDAITLNRQDGGSSETLITGTVGGASDDPTAVRVRVELNDAGGWVLLVDYTGGTDFISEGGANDSTYNSGSYFGWRCRYTATRGDKFFLDDVFVGPLFVDTEPPQVLNASAENNTTVLLNFNEPIVDFSVANFSIDNGITVENAETDAVNPALIRLTISPTLQNFTTYNVTVSDVQDAEGNVLVNQTVGFDFLQAEPVAEGDIIINEIMADPTPTQGLPDAEFVEIYNRSQKVIELSTLFFVSDASPDRLSEGLILPGEYVIICDDGFAGDFAPFGQVATVTSMPALSNGGDEAGIVDAAGNEIDRTDYSDDWYNDEEKADGGFTLERVGALADSNCSGNWRASNDNQGGTPGAVNSVNGQFTDTEAPLIISVVPENASAITVTFSKGLDGDEAREELNYSIDNGITVSSAGIQNAENTSVLLILDTPLQGGTSYTLTVSNAVGDCLGNMTVEDQRKSFGLAEAPAPLDIVINEILFNPYTGGSDYVEFLNNSEKIINFSEFGVSPFQMFPGEIVVLTEDREDVLRDYTVENPANLFLADLPSYNNDAGEVVLTIGGVTIDSFAYSEDLHFELLRDENGVALERIDPDAPTNAAGNWHSAASLVGYGTPTAENSQLMPTEVPAVADFFTIENPRVSPDEDGFEDVLVINYKFDEPGYTANIQIFDAQGRLVKSLNNNELLGFEGSLKWDGSTNDKAKARIGIYVFYAEVFRPDGSVAEQKEAITVAGRL